MNKSKKLHILILPSWYPNTFNLQQGIFFQEQAEALARNKHIVGVLYIHEIHRTLLFNGKRNFYSNKVFYKNNVYTNIIEYPAIPKLHKLRYYIKKILFKKMFKDYIKIHGLPNIIHVHSFMVGEFAIWIKENYGIPYVVTEHYSGFALNKISNNNLLNATKVFAESSCNIAVSRNFKYLLESKLDKKFITIPNIVNTSFFTPINKINNKEFNLINIGFLNKNKNQDMLIKAFASSFQDNLSIKLTIVGDGPCYNELKALITKMKLCKQVKLYGRADRIEIKNLLQNSDAFVLSSKYETFGVVVIEALACGLPVVATRCGGIEDIVISNKLGFLSDINQKSLSLNLNKLYMNRFNYNKNYIRKYVDNNFSEEVVIKKIEKLYKQLLE